MSNTTILYLILIAIFALGIAVFQYFYKAKTTFNKRIVFALLRFGSLFLLGMLLLNPTFEQTVLTQEKPRLVVVVDNSKSVAILNHDTVTKNVLKKIKESNLKDKFTVDYFGFDTEVNQLNDALEFKGRQTNISKVFPLLKDIYNEKQAPTILISDGNQTFGQDYVLASQTYNQPIYPVVIGDTLVKQDLKITTIQLNKYTTLKNEFPVEISIAYNGKETINKDLVIFKNKIKVYSKTLTFSENNTLQVVQLNLPALKIGKQQYKASIAAIPNEENTVNNKRNFSVEVIDQRTNVLLVSDILHPDLGAYKKAIETHQLRKVTLVKPADVSNIDNYQLVILFQPTIQFKSLFKQLKLTGKNHLIVTGVHTDWQFLNSQKDEYKRLVVNELQEVTGALNPAFNLFQKNTIRVNSLPPLHDAYGAIELQAKANTLLYQKINSIETSNPILTFFEEDTRREALFVGEGIWKWRAQSYLNTQSFEVFDEFIGQVIQYLASNTKKERLTVDVADEFLLGEAEINAQYFDRNYVPDPNATLLCRLTNTETNAVYEYNFLFNTSNYSLNLSSLPAGKYRYSITVENEKLNKKGEFLISSFDIEAQFLNPDVTKLSLLATNSQNKLFTITESDQLISSLMTDNQFKPIQKEQISQLPLINWKYLLAVLLVLLTFEWLLRKYNGLL